MVEDSEQDAHLLEQQQPYCHGFDACIVRVQNEIDFKAQLVSQPWELIIADFSLPQFSAAAALLLLREGPPRGGKKAAIVLQLKRLPPSAVLRFEDEIILHLRSERCRAWSLRGQQAQIPITGLTAKCIHPLGHPQSTDRASDRGSGLLSEVSPDPAPLLPGRQIGSLLGQAACQTVPQSQALAEA